MKLLLDQGKNVDNLPEHDKLTGLFKGKYVVALLEQTIAKAKQGTTIAVLFGDIDHFHHFNHHHGHVLGDEVIAAIAAAIKDSVGQSGIVGRYGGDEFLIFMPDTSPDIAQETAEKIVQEVQKVNIEVKGNSIGAFSITVGVSFYPQHGNNTEALFRKADEALFEGKRAGRNRVMMAG